MQGEIFEHDESVLINRDSMYRLSHIIYALQALSFIFGITYLIAVIALVINYVKLDDVHGSWLESHFRWQINTFWLGLVWYVVGLLTVFILIGWVILIATYLWLIYRVVKGWIYLNDKKPI